MFTILVDGEIGNAADETEIAEELAQVNGASILNGTDDEAVVILFAGSEEFEDVVVVARITLLNIDSTLQVVIVLHGCLKWAGGASSDPV